MTPSLLHGMNGMETKDIEKLDLKYQYTMLARHVKEFLDEISDYDTYNEGIYHIVDDDFEPMRKRLEVINSIIKKNDTRYKEVCEVFAQEEAVQESGMTMNYWPSSQICMDCEHSVFIMSEDEPSATYACKQGVQLGSCASVCSKFEEIGECLGE